MKKLASITVLLILVLTLAACSTAPQSSQPNPAAPAGGSNPANPAAVPPTGAAPDNNNQGNPASSQIPDELRLLIGTIKLEGTDQAVTAAQAVVLLPLWQSLKEAQGSMQPKNDPANGAPAAGDDTLRQKMDEQLEQIRAEMTPEQLKAIEDMHLTREDVQAFFKEQGLSMGGPGTGNGTLMPPQGTPPAGAMPEGAGNPGGGNSGDQGNGAPNPPQGTLSADMPGSVGGPGGGPGSMLPPGLLDALIQFLQKKAAS